MAEFGVGDDALRRDLAFLADAGYAIDFSREESKAGRTMVRMRSPSFVDVPITRDEAHTFAGSRRLWEPLKGTPFYDDFESIYRKLVETLPAKERAEIERDRARFFCIPDGGVLPYDDKRSVVEALRLGAVARRRVSFDYRTKAGRHRSGLMEPFAIGVHKNTVYVLGRLVPSRRALAAGSTPRLEWVSWPAHRFVEVKLTRSEFEVPSDFRLEDHFDGWGIMSGGPRQRVVVEFDREVAPLVAERRWHLSQRLETLPDGAGVRLTCEVANTSEVLAWILQYGSHAIVVEPESLRTQILREFTAGATRIMARIPTGPDPPQGWLDESERIFDAEEMHAMRENVSNENNVPEHDPSHRAKTREADAIDNQQAGGSDWDEPAEPDQESPIWDKRGGRL